MDSWPFLLSGVLASGMVPFVHITFHMSMGIHYYKPLFFLHSKIHYYFGMLLQMMLNSKDLSFVGYTYKNFEAVKGLHQSAGLLSTPSVPIYVSSEHLSQQSR
jgi:hypothetical protein